MRAQSIETAGRLSNSVKLNLPFKTPYDWQAIIQYFQSHSIPGVERVTGDSFARVFRVGNEVGFVEVRPLLAKSQLKVWIVSEDPETTSETARRVRKMFDLDCDPVLIAKSFERIPVLADLCRRFPGLRVARGWDCFETVMVRDAVAAAANEEGSGLDAAMINWRFMANAVWSTEETVRRMAEAAKATAAPARSPSCKAIR